MKTQLLLITLVLFIGCKKEDIQPEKLTNIIETKDTLSIGHSYKGGVLAYILQSGDPGFVSGEIHGLIVTNNDVAKCTWDNPNVKARYERHGDTATAIGSGMSNTNIIVSALGPGRYAAYVCDTLNQNGYSDWYLPSKNEMIVVAKNITNLTTGSYWTSSQMPVMNTWTIGVGYGWSNEAQQEDFTFINVRAVRSF